jgi:hypothetical protein
LPRKAAIKGAPFFEKMTQEREFPYKFMPKK